MNKILVTGGAGYIGSHTIVELVNAGYMPIIVDDFSNADRSVLAGLKNILGSYPKIYVGDCTDKSFMEEVFQKENIQGVIHFAAHKAVGESVQQPLKYYRNNINSLLVLLEIMSDLGVKNLIFSSSCTVYGQPNELPVTEDTPKKTAESPYGNTKAICEEIIEDTVKSRVAVKGVSLRYFNPIGAHPSSEIGELPLGLPNNLVPFLMQTAAGSQKELTVFGNDYNTPDGSCIRDYIHVLDLAKAHVQALKYIERQSENSLYKVFNVGTGNGNSVIEVIQSFEKVSGIKLKHKIGARRPGDTEQIYADVSKIKKELNWQAELSLEEALKDAWNWQKKISNL